MGWTQLFAVSVLLLSAGAHADDRLSGAGESCDRTADCRRPLRCVEGTCVAPGEVDEPVEVDPVLERRTRATLQSVAHALQTYEARHGTSAADLRAVVRERLLRAFQLVDGWGEPLRYRPVTDGARVCSKGPDHLPRTSDDLCSDD